MSEQVSDQLSGVSTTPTVTRAAAAPRPSRPGPRRSRGSLAVPYLLLVLPVTLVAVALGYPMVKQFIMSFQEFGLAQQFGQPPAWVGLDNYTQVLTDSYFWIVVARSVAFCAVCAVLTMAAGIAVAVLLQQLSVFARIALQVALVLAWAMPPLAALTVYTWVTEPRYGLLNWVLSAVGLDEFRNFSWLAGNQWTFFAVAGIAVIWTSVPLVALSTYAALNQVDEEVLEAAQLDGAGGWTRLRAIVLPIVQPVILLLFILQIIWDLKVFTQIKVLQSSAGNNKATNLLGTYVYETGIGGGNYGVASALATIMLLLVLALTFRYMRSLMKQGGL